MPVYEFIVTELKTRLDKFLVGQMAPVSRSKIQCDIEGGYVEVNGQPVLESKFLVRINDKVVYKQNDKNNNKNNETEIVNAPLKILYNNHGLLIIDKPAGLTVHPGAGFKGNTLVSALLYEFKDIKLVGEEGRPGIVHRLDKDTSGVILVAKTQEMYEYLKNAFADRRIKKEYVALVAGRVEKPHGFIETPIGRSKTDFRKYTTKNPVQEKESLTEYKVLEYLEPGDQSISETVNQQNKSRIDNYTLLLVKLHSGRTHQIRVHFSSLGHPLMGDSLYGTKKTVLPNLQRQFLHAKKIEVQLPDKTWIEAESEMPPDLKEVLRKLHSKIIETL